VVVVTAFEQGEDMGDAPGEFQAWASEMPQTLPFPLGWRHLRYDPARQTLAIMTSMGTNRAAISTLALGLDPRFDLSHAYWVVAAIAGVNPNAASLGSAAWIGDVVDSDFAYVVDPRELPKDWIGIMPWGRKEPYAKPVDANKSYNLFPLNRGLRDWAYQRTKDVALPDSTKLQKARAAYKNYPKALKPPHVLVGDEVTGQGFWHGERMNAHAERWIRYWAGDQARFVMTGMEDTGVINAIQRLQAAGKADASRVLVLRAGSNYSLPPKGQSPVAAEMSTEFDGAAAAFQAAHLVARPVVDELAGHWDRYRDNTPSN
ncbi:MAG: purine nucleoside permease, partial [Caulobacteraceae bacterium]